MTTREERIAGIRQLADLLEQHPEFPMPYHLESAELSIMFFSGDNDRDREDMARVARLIPGKLTKDVRESGEYGDYFDLHGRIAGIKIKLTAYRDAVCKRVVTGTRTETKTVPDPELLEAVPTITVTETVEDVEWVCGPLLAESVPA